MKLHENLDTIRQQTASRVQRGHIEAAGASVTIPLEPVDVSRAQ